MQLGSLRRLGRVLGPDLYAQAVAEEGERHRRDRRDLRPEVVGCQVVEEETSHVLSVGFTESVDGTGEGNEGRVAEIFETSVQAFVLALLDSASRSGHVEMSSTDLE